MMVTSSLPSSFTATSGQTTPTQTRTNVPITINDADFFVSTQYVDFLSRFPDQSGFNFWTNDITDVRG
jgi:hypothetical protein